MAIVSSRHQVIKELFDALELPSDDIYAFNLNIRPEEIVNISIQLYVQDKKLGRIPGIIKRFHLVEVGDTDLVEVGDTDLVEVGDTDLVEVGDTENKQHLT